jgi:uncharacterized MAPEG superfamily protein
MTAELFTLVALSLLALLLPVIYLFSYTRDVGVKAMLGNRDGLPERTGIAARGTRAHANLIENLVPFAGVVLSAQALGISNAITQAAAMVFLIARLIHLASYLAGVAVVRTIAYYAGILSIFTIAWQLLF